MKIYIENGEIDIERLNLTLNLKISREMNEDESEISKLLNELARGARDHEEIVLLVTDHNSRIRESMRLHWPPRIPREAILTLDKEFLSEVRHILIRLKHTERYNSDGRIRYGWRKLEADADSVIVRIDAELGNERKGENCDASMRGEDGEIYFCCLKHPPMTYNNEHQFKIPENGVHYPLF